jgi:Ca2+-binding RTX toxin-like protein
MLATCPLAGAGELELDMGPSGDMVEVLDRLPMPLTAHLGAGSDKFIGNGEKDTCYSEQSRRNRCIGGPGNDVCITGNQNSDCVGGAGDDYCQTGAGSDGCWGGPGNDVCRMGPGQDGCHGEGGNDELFGGPSPDQLYGGSDFDRCDGLPGWGRSHECEAGPGR